MANSDYFYEMHGYLYTYICLSDGIFHRGAHIVVSRDYSEYTVKLLIMFVYSSLNPKVFSYLLSSIRLLNFSLGYTKLVTPKGKNQHTLRKL